MHGDQHSECAQAYCEYAKALLRKVQAESSPFGSAGPKPEAKATGEAGSSSADGAAAAAAAPDEGDACDDDDEGGAGEAGGEEGEGEGEGEEEADDLELAFQCFEVARLAYEKAGADESLADVHEFLGEVHLENSHWEDAMAEFEASLGIKQKLLPSDDRQLATLHFMLANAAVAEMEDRAQGKADDAAPAAPGEAGSSSAPTPEAAAASEEQLRAQARKHYEAAADVLERKLSTLAADANADEAADVKEIIADLREKISEFSAAAAPPAAGTGGSEGVTTIGFGSGAAPSASAGVTTIGFGAAGGADSGSSSGFSAASSSALPVKCLGTVTTTNAAGRKKAVLVPLSTNSSEGAAPVSAKREAEAAAEPAEAEAKKAKVE